MSGWLEPIGPLPPSVYWRRRIVVLAIALIVIVLLWWLVFGRGSSGDSDSGGGGGGGATSSSAAPTTSAAPTSSAAPTTSSAPTTSAAPEPTSTDDPGCADSVIAVAVAADPQESVQGGEMIFTLTITNTSDAACARDIGPRANEIQVSVADARLWSSDDCSPSTDSNRIVLQAGETYVTEAPWDQSTSNPGCTTSVEVDAGVYEVYGRNGDVISDATLITINPVAQDDTGQEQS